MGEDGGEDRLGGVAAQVEAVEVVRIGRCAEAGEEAAHGARVAGDDGEAFGRGDEMLEPEIAACGEAAEVVHDRHRAPAGRKAVEHGRLPVGGDCGGVRTAAQEDGGGEHGEGGGASG